MTQDPPVALPTSAPFRPLPTRRADAETCADPSGVAAPPVRAALEVAA
ncbi:hypothetical protein ACGF07_29135 [Kitasatospora sp. NPDC048194]